MIARLLRTITAYASALRDYYGRCWEPIARSNLQMLRRMSALAVLVLSASVLAALLAHGVGLQMYFCVGGLVAHLVFAILLRIKEHTLRWRTRLIPLLCVLFVILQLVLVIGTGTVGMTGQPGIFFAPMTLLLSMMFIFPPWKTVLLVTVACVAFVGLSAQYKAPAQHALDMAIAGTTWVLCMLTDMVLLDLRVRDLYRQSELMQLSCLDSLTGLLNKNAAEEAIHAYFQRNSAGEGAALFVIDLDQFKQINDHQGHRTGDEALEVFGHALRKLFRPQDIVGRVGGDEFVALMKNVSDRGLIVNRAALICETVRQNGIGDTATVLTCSIGVALYPEHGRGFRTLFNRADQQLYAVKHNGRNGYSLAEEPA